VMVLVNAESRRPAENPVGRVLREGQIAGLANHTVLISKAGRETPIDDSAAPIRGQDGRLLGVVMVFRDIAERKRAEERFRLVVESAPSGMVMVNSQGRIVLVNAHAERLFGYRRSELVGQPVDILVPERFRTVHAGFRQGFMADMRTRAMGAGRDLYALRKDGAEFPVEIGLSPIVTTEGRFVLSAIVDITERRALERVRDDLLEQERASRAEAERVTRMLRHVQGVTDITFRDVPADGLMHELLSRVRTALASDTATILLLTADGTHLVPISSDGLREAVVEDVQVPIGRGVAGRIASSEGGMIFGDISEEETLSAFLRDRVKSLVGAPLRVGDRLIGVIHVGSSAPRQFTEEDLTLLRLVADRIAFAIERARLHEAERRARHDADVANQAKDRFLATVSHELRTPLNAIVGWVHVLRAGKPDEATLARALDVIDRSASLQARLVDDLMDMSRIITGRLRLDLSPVDLGAVIEAAIDVVRPAADAKEIRIETALDTAARLISGDPGRLQQVLWNLLSNAVKFTSRRGRVTVRLERVDSWAELAVTDTGEGITAELLPHVFERFRQATPVGGRAPGLGLGLAIVRHLVELHGGTVRAESAGKDQGATFIVTLPLLAGRVPVSGVGEGSRALGHGPGPAAAPVLGGVRVLVADDEADPRELLRTVLEQHGAEVIAAGSAAEALALLQRERPDVLISDIAMPDSDGYALIRKVRGLVPERGGRIPAVALTAHARTQDRTRALEAGFQLHVPKPVEAAELVAVVASLLGRTPTGPNAAGLEHGP
jgi:PAS domain S-box-containing protein